MDIGRSLFLFLVAGLCEIGGYFVWLWLRQGKGIWLGLLGAIVLALYGIIPTLQSANFGRVFAAYGGVFIVLAMLWGWKVDRVTPDRFDIIWAGLALAGMLVMVYWPRGG